MNKPKLIMTLCIFLSAAFLYAASPNYGDTLQNKTFLFSDANSTHQYTFGVKTVKMIMKMQGKDYTNDMDIVMKDDKSMKIILFSTAADRKKTLAKNKKATFNYVVYFWEKISATEVKLIIPRKTAATLADASKIEKPAENEAGVVLLKKK